MNGHHHYSNGMNGHGHGFQQNGAQVHFDPFMMETENGHGGVEVDSENNLCMPDPCQTHTQTPAPGELCDPTQLDGDSFLQVHKPQLIDLEDFSSVDVEPRSGLESPDLSQEEDEALNGASIAPGESSLQITDQEIKLQVEEYSDEEDLGGSYCRGVLNSIPEEAALGTSPGGKHMVEIPSPSLQMSPLSNNGDPFDGPSAESLSEAFENPSYKVTNGHHEEVDGLSQGDLNGKLSSQEEELIAKPIPSEDLENFDPLSESAMQVDYNADLPVDDLNKLETPEILKPDVGRNSETQEPASTVDDEDNHGHINGDEDQQMDCKAGEVGDVAENEIDVEQSLDDQANVDKVVTENPVEIKADDKTTGEFEGNEAMSSREGEPDLEIGAFDIENHSNKHVSSNLLDFENKDTAQDNAEKSPEDPVKEEEEGLPTNEQTQEDVEILNEEGKSNYTEEGVHPVDRTENPEEALESEEPENEDPGSNEAPEEVQSQNDEGVCPEEESSDQGLVEENESSEVCDTFETVDPVASESAIDDESAEILGEPGTEEKLNEDEANAFNEASEVTTGETKDEDKDTNDLPQEEASGEEKIDEKASDSQEEAEEQMSPQIFDNKVEQYADTAEETSSERVENQPEEPQQEKLDLDIEAEPVDASENLCPGDLPSSAVEDIEEKENVESMCVDDHLVDFEAEPDAETEEIEKEVPLDSEEPEGNLIGDETNDQQKIDLTGEDKTESQLEDITNIKDPEDEGPIDVPEKSQEVPESSEPEVAELEPEMRTECKMGEEATTEPDKTTEDALQETEEDKTQLETPEETEKEDVADPGELVEANEEQEAEETPEETQHENQNTSDYNLSKDLEERSEPGSDEAKPELKSEDFDSVEVGINMQSDEPIDLAEKVEETSELQTSDIVRTIDNVSPANKEPVEPVVEEKSSEPSQDFAEEYPDKSSQEQDMTSKEEEKESSEIERKLEVESKADVNENEPIGNEEEAALPEELSVDTPEIAETGEKIGSPVNEEATSIDEPKASLMEDQSSEVGPVESADSNDIFEATSEVDSKEPGPCPQEKVTDEEKVDDIAPVDSKSDEQTESLLASETFSAGEEEEKEIKDAEPAEEIAPEVGEKASVDIVENDKSERTKEEEENLSAEESVEPDEPKADAAVKQENIESSIEEKPKQASEDEELDVQYQHVGAPEPSNESHDKTDDEILGETLPVDDKLEETEPEPDVSLGRESSADLAGKEPENIPENVKHECMAIEAEALNTVPEPAITEDVSGENAKQETDNKVTPVDEIEIKNLETKDEKAEDAEETPDDSKSEEKPKESLEYVPEKSANTLSNADAASRIDTPECLVSDCEISTDTQVGSDKIADKPAEVLSEKEPQTLQEPGNETDCLKTEESNVAEEEKSTVEEPKSDEPEKVTESPKPTEVTKKAPNKDTKPAAAAKKPTTTPTAKTTSTTPTTRPKTAPSSVGKATTPSSRAAPVSKPSSATSSAKPAVSARTSTTGAKATPTSASTAPKRTSAPASVPPVAKTTTTKPATTPRTTAASKSSTSLTNGAPKPAAPKPTTASAVRPKTSTTAPSTSATAAKVPAKKPVPASAPAKTTPGASLKTSTVTKPASKPAEAKPTTTTSAAKKPIAAKPTTSSVRPTAKTTESPTLNKTSKTPESKAPATKPTSTMSKPATGASPAAAAKPRVSTGAAAAPKTGPVANGVSTAKKPSIASDVKKPSSATARPTPSLAPRATTTKTATSSVSKK